MMRMSSLALRRLTPLGASCSGRSAAAAPARLARPSVQPRGRRTLRALVRAQQRDEQDEAQANDAPPPGPLLPLPADEAAARSAVESWLNPPKEELPDALEMPIWDHLGERTARSGGNGLPGAVVAGATAQRSGQAALSCAHLLHRPPAAPHPPPPQTSCASACWWALWRQGLPC